MDRKTVSIVGAIVVVGGLFANAGDPDPPKSPIPTLMLTSDPEVAHAGDPVVVTLSMLNLGDEEAAGFQAFLTFDNSRLTFVSGSYTPAPFGLPFFFPIEAVSEDIDLSAGINFIIGQVPTSEDAELVHLTFEAEVDGCISSVDFRDDPATMITDADGLAITPLQLIGLPDDCPEGQACDETGKCVCDSCPTDVDGDGNTGPLDLAFLLGYWGPVTPDSQCLDDDSNGNIGPFDLAFVLGNWGPCD